MAVIDHRIDAARRPTTEQHAAFAGSIRHSFERLRTGLNQAHARCAWVGEQTWAAYMADLDNGLDERDKEIARAAESAADPAVEQILRVHITALALAGWRLQVNLPTGHNPVTTR